MQIDYSFWIFYLLSFIKRKKWMNGNIIVCFQVPPPLNMDDDYEDKFVFVNPEDCEISGDRDEVYQKLQESLVSQIQVTLIFFLSYLDGFKISVQF